MFRRIQTGGRWLLLCRYHSLMLSLVMFLFWKFSLNLDIMNYNPPTNFCQLSLDKTDHVIQIRRYVSSDLISSEEKPKHHSGLLVYRKFLLRHMRNIYEMLCMNLKSHRAMKKANWHVISPRGERREKWIWICFSQNFCFRARHVPFCRKICSLLLCTFGPWYLNGRQ